MHRFSDICHLSGKGESKVNNEDLAFVEKNLVVLLSGALRDSPHDVMSRTRTDTKWFIDEICSIVRDQYNTSKTFLDVLQAAIDTTTFRYVHKSNRLNSNPYAISERGLPSSSMGAVTIEGGCVIVYVIGDCDILLRQKDGNHVIRVNAYNGEGADRDLLCTDIRSTRNVARFDLTALYNVMSGDELLMCSRGMSRLYQESKIVSVDLMFSEEPHVLMQVLREHDGNAGKRSELDATMIRWVIA